MLSVSSRVRVPASMLVRAFSTNAASAGVSSLGIIGGGQMGVGIAYVGAMTCQLPVTIVDRSEKQLTSALDYIRKQAAKDVAKGKLTEEVAARMQKLVTTSTDIGSVSTAPNR